MRYDVLTEKNKVEPVCWALFVGKLPKGYTRMGWNVVMTKLMAGARFVIQPDFGRVEIKLPTEEFWNEMMALIMTSAADVSETVPNPDQITEDLLTEMGADWVAIVSEDYRRIVAVTSERLDRLRAKNVTPDFLPNFQILPSYYLARRFYRQDLSREDYLELVDLKELRQDLMKKYFVEGVDKVEQLRNILYVTQGLPPYKTAYSLAIMQRIANQSVLEVRAQFEDEEIVIKPSEVKSADE